MLRVSYGVQKFESRGDSETLLIFTQSNEQRQFGHLFNGVVKSQHNLPASFKIMRMGLALL